MIVSAENLHPNRVRFVRFLFVACFAVALSFVALARIDNHTDGKRLFLETSRSGFVAKADDGVGGNSDDLMVRTYRGTPHLERVNVAPNYLFETGDLIQIEVTSKRNGFIYILTLGSKGPDIIFPFYNKDTKERKVNHIDAGETITTPSKTEFGELTGSGPETIFVIFISDPFDPILSELNLIVDKKTIGFGDDKGRRLFGDIQQRAVPARNKLLNQSQPIKACVDYSLSASAPSPLVMQFSLERD